MTAALLATGAGLVTAMPANAAPGDVSGATLDWGFKASWRSYVAAFGGTATAADDAAVTGSGYTWGTGSGSRTGGGSVEYTGDLTWAVPAHGITNIRLSDLIVAVDSSGAGTITADYDYTTTSSASGTDVIATFTAGTPTDANGVLTYSNVPVTGTAKLGEIFGASYGAGTALDTMTFSWPYEAAPVQQTTTTSLVAAPTPSTEGTPVSLTATVSPAAAGTVEFFDGTTSLGSAPTSSGVATTSATALTVGSHQLSAVFTPTDAAAFTSSTSQSVTHSVTAATTPAVTTTTTLAAAPAGPTFVGTASTLTATVTATTGTAAGTVEFRGVRAGSTTSTVLGTAPVVNGVATYSTTLAAGATAITAVFVPSTGFAASQTATAQNFRIVDSTVTAVCAPASSATSSTGATARWGMSVYSDAWTKSATGDVTVDGETFVFAGGDVTADANCARIEFDGSLSVLPYPGMSPAQFTLTDPVLTLGRDGRGSWSADMTTDTMTTAKRVTFATFTGATGAPAAGAAGAVTATPAYAGTTAPGTWSGEYADAWPNQFIAEVPSAIRAFFYLSGTTPAQANKPPAAVTLNFTWPAAAVTPPVVVPPITLPSADPASVQKECVARAVSGASVEWGVKQSFRSYISGPIANGSVTFSSVAENGGDYRWTGGTGSFNTDGSIGQVGFGGSVRFTGHGGQLDLKISDVRVRVTGANTASLIADVKSNSLNGPDVDASGIVLATLALPSADRSSSEISWSNASATLTSTGAQAFGGFYQSGTALDPVSFAFPLGGEVACGTYTDTAIASTGVRADLALGVALAMLVAGLAVVVIRRRVRSAA
ncbi:HtaA domain-containing protein [Herbiconiux sp. L3-i23]|uniref:HtaA domain-containing protein n=1 Tax=Herbiconiux sp. L3-i23 TaxID=2905871 RepID=UPI002050C08D|nr:HtaA domain-containing protein [Herbiconiux sp. L3-i23]BDI23040.1 hypothetical protein L3i23_18160 [Herbiconiux sp. L3-i23]